MAAIVVRIPQVVGPLSSSSIGIANIDTRKREAASHALQFHSSSFSSLHLLCRFLPLSHRPQFQTRNPSGFCVIASSLHSSSARPSSSGSTKLFVSGLSFRTTEDSLRNAFQRFGQLVEVNLVMDRVANRPRGFAFLRYATEEESKQAIEGMHGKFLDGRVIFVEVAKPRSEVRQNFKQSRLQD
ncbi:hypothetical protein NMG60_11023654 [Bertholletia excelsa]